MTREEAIEMVEMAFAEWENEFFVSGDDWSKEHEALDMAVKALEQEPMLDKISAEIEEIVNEIGVRGYGQSIKYGLSIALEIIDKYKYESEGRNDKNNM